MSEGSLTSVETRQNLSRLIPPEIADILGHPPVLSTENREAYDALMTQLVLEWKPRDILGWLFVRHMTDGVRQANRRKSPQRDAEYRSAHEVGKSALPRKFSASRPFVQSARRPGACRGNGPNG